MIIQQNLSDVLHLSIAKSCQTLEVSRCGYFKWINRQVPFSRNDDIGLRNEIQDIVVEFPDYGYRSVTAELRNRRNEVNPKRVLRLMREDNLAMLEEEIQAGHNQFQSRIAGLSQPAKEHPDL